MATRLTKKQQAQLTEKLTGIIQKNNALQLRLSADRSVNEMNVNQISGALNRIHGQAIGKELPTVVTIPVKQLGSGDPSPDNIRPFVGYEIDGIGTVYGGDLNIETRKLTSEFGYADLGALTWSYTGNAQVFVATLTGAKYIAPSETPVNCLCSMYKGVSWSVGSTNVSVNNMFCFLTEYNQLRIRDLTYSDAAAFKNHVNGVIFIYQLAEPAEYTLTDVQMIQLLDQL